MLAASVRNRDLAAKSSVRAFPILKPNGSDQTLDERMRDGNVLDCFDFVNLEESKIGFLPTMGFEQGVMIGAQ
jgi:hypothetical protein